MTFYDDAELAAIQVLRESAEEHYDRQAVDRVGKIASGITMPLYEQHGSEGLHALIIALGRQWATSWTAALEKRLGHYPSREEMLTEIDSYEMYKIEQHVTEEEDLLDPDEDDAAGEPEADR